MSIFGKTSEILGLNARNLLYITQYNSRANKKFADDKIYTKHFLQARGIGVARLYATIKSLSELKNFNKNVLPKSFVVKPNKGYGGEGIITIKDKQADVYIGLNGQRYKWADLYNHCISILDGRFAISGLRDTVIFEELLESHDYFKKYIESGLPDIRIIVFKYVPIIAMLRLPTAASQGKANLHIGAIGLGIDIGTGKTTFGVQNNRLIKKLPSGESVRSLIIPQWDDILKTAVNTQHITQIGYLAVDLALTKNGIKILEVNARAGLAIQISNQVLLRKRLEKVADLKVSTPAEGVKIGKTLFTRIAKKSTDKTTMPKPLIGLYEQISLLNARQSSVLAKIDPHSSNTIIDNSLEIEPNKKLLSVKIRDKKIRMPFIRTDLSKANYKVILAGKYLSDFLIDTTKTTKEKEITVSSQTKEEKILQNVDKKIYEINEKIHILSRLKPLNLDEEQKKFLKKPDYSPQFVYQKHDLNITYLKNELKKIPTHVDHPLIPLYLKKIEETNHKLSLIEAIGQPEITQYSQKIFGHVTEEQYHQAISFIKNNSFQEDKSKKLRLETVIEKLNNYLAEKKLSHWKIKVLDNATADMQTNKKNNILLNKKAKISASRLKALIAHEIETHIFRLENGRLQKYRIFEQGTAGYLFTEEGLAIHNQNKLNLPLGEKYFWPALNIIAIYQGARLSFVELFHYLLKNYKISKNTAWKICVKVKRGLGNTNEKGVFTKDLVYFVGYNMIERLIADKSAEELKKLYVGKISIQDLKYVSDSKQWPTKYLPALT